MYLKKFLILVALFAFNLPATAKEQVGDLLSCPNIIDLSDGKEKGQTWLQLMKETIKPTLDSYVTEGYQVADGQTLVDSLDKVDSKVRRQALAAVKGQNLKQKKVNLIKIGDSLATEMVNLHNLPSLLGKTGLVTDRFKLSTYVGLASCAGANTKLADDNYAYNIHYGTGEVKMDKRSGRSFGASRVSKATDASYSHYLQTLEDYVTNDPGNTKHFFTTIMETLTNTQTRRYDKVTDQGDGVLTDFFAILAAEQDRNLMDGKVDVHWDAALLQTTLLSAFHAGQETLKVMYKDPMTGQRFFTDTTFSLVWPKKPRRDDPNQVCTRDWDSRKAKDASLTDYIGISSSPSPRHCSRSGLNITKKEWRLLSKEITSYLEADNKGKKMLANVRKHLKNTREEGDILRELAKFLISDQAPARISSWYNMSRNVVSLLEYVRQEAPKITQKLEAKYDSRQ